MAVMKPHTHEWTQEEMDKIGTKILKWVNGWNAREDYKLDALYFDSRDGDLCVWITYKYLCDQYGDADPSGEWYYLTPQPLYLTKTGRVTESKLTDWAECGWSPVEGFIDDYLKHTKNYLINDGCILWEPPTE